ncbi:MAG: DNA polymerase IV [Kiloniellales bacterium]|nr:DNA polymerase IV [Kiloniellales bacterium]
MTALCRDCLEGWDQAPVDARCPRCGAPRLLCHPELEGLAIAHIDCDAFYASVEKRDRPELRDKPVIVGGGRRGVVSTACYVARLYGVHSAMPMFKALKACPDAVVLRPDMAKYAAIGREIRAMMRAVTPLVEPLSIDEAFLDLGGTEALHEGSPARTLCALAQRIERELDLTVSIGLSYNKFLAKVASDLDKPRGFAVIGRAEAMDFLAPQPVGLIWGVGKALRTTLARDGIRLIGDLRPLEEMELIARYGAIGRRLYNFCRGMDTRSVEPNSPTKSISSETTFDEDITAGKALAARLWPLCESVARRLKRAELAGQSVTLKLKTAQFRILTRSRRLNEPTQLAEVLYGAACALLEREADGRAFRLIGVGAADLVEGALADPPDLLDPDRMQRANVERAIDAVRDKLGASAIRKGRDLDGLATRGEAAVSSPAPARRSDRPGKHRG